MTIGVFDAIHRGHQALIRRAKEQASVLGVRSLVFTFERHPLALLAPAYCPPTLLQPEIKARLIESLGIDLCLLLPFTAEVAATPADEFIKKILAGRCRARYVVCGKNFSFGAGGKGNARMLAELGPKFGFKVEVFDPVLEGHHWISSTRVRDTLLEGSIRHATEMLSRRYGFQAKVVTGDARGRTIGFPTANLVPAADQLVPADGVYAVAVSVLDDQGAKSERHGGMLNIGQRPTFEGAGRSMEVHLFDFSRELVGRTVEIEFIERIRDEKKFSGVETLVAQLREDEATCRKILATT